jgi:serine/threonine protein phosphatase PrpC
VSFLASWLPFGFVRASASARKAALSSARIDRLETSEGAATFIAGGAQTEGALPVATPYFEAAVFSSRGRGYARYNEDAAGLFCDQRGFLYALVLDQAGGLGGRVRGQGSQVAACHIFDGCQKIARAADLAATDPLEPLRLAFDRAHRVLVQREEGEVTTAVALVFEPGRALLINSGDSGALHFGADGKIKGRTRLQELDGANLGCLEHGLGLVPEGASPEEYRWDLEPNDWIVAATDGLLDAGIGEDALGKLLTSASSAEQAVNRVATIVLRRMGTFRAKPDNLTLVAVRVLTAAASTKQS